MKDLLKNPMSGRINDFNTVTIFNGDTIMKFRMRNEKRCWYTKEKRLDIKGNELLDWDVEQNIDLEISRIIRRRISQVEWTERKWENTSEE